MKQLFVDLYLDEDVDVLISDLVRARGFSSTTTQEAGHLGNTEAQQLAFAAAQGKTLLTHNRADFEALARQYVEENKTHSGIIIAVRRKPQDLCRRVLILLNLFTADEMENQVRYI